MKIYVSTISENPVKAAIKAAEHLGYQTDPDGREYYFQADEKYEYFDQFYCDDPDGEDTITWGCGVVKGVTPSNNIEVEFYC